GRSSDHISTIVSICYGHTGDVLVGERRSVIDGQSLNEVRGNADMLNTLIIKDFAIIDRLEISLAAGMTVLTGETGAGKSIIINALNLLLGGRASTDVIRASSDCAVVEGAFDLSGAQGSSIRERLVELDIDCEDTTLVIRRVVSRTGRNKVLLNGSLATVATLRELLR